MKRILWIICLDRSGSMGKGFSASIDNIRDFRGRLEATEKQIKLDAAKDAVLREIAGLDPSSEIAIFAFDDHPEEIYKGQAYNLDKIKYALSMVRPGNQTNIADCILKSLDFIDEYDRIDCLAVTDGLSNVGDPVSAARKCNEDGIIINIALIDPTSEGENIAKKIAANGGRVYAVTSAVELDRDIGFEGIRQQLLKERHERQSLARFFESTMSEVNQFSSNFKQRLNSFEGVIKESQYGLKKEIEQLKKDRVSVTELNSDFNALIQSFSLGIPIDHAPIRRLIPIRAYLKPGSGISIETVSMSINRIIKEISFELAEDYPSQEGSWWKRWTSRSKDALTHPEVQERLEKIERAIELKSIHIPQAKVDRDLASAVAELVKSLEKESEAALQVGSILILKTLKNDGNSKTMVRTLSPGQLAILEKNPDHLKEPSNILRLLKGESPKVETEKSNN